MELTTLWIIVISICCFCGLLLLFKLVNKLTAGKCTTNKKLNGQVIIVTGSNTGIGKAAALDFAKREAKVILACRDLVKAHKAREEIVEISNNTNVIVRHLDLTSLKSVKKFASEIIATENRLDVLVNNAGIGHFSDEETEDGLQLLLQVNHYAPFLLTNLLIDLLKKSAPSRIVHVSSMLHFCGRVGLENANFRKGLLYTIIFRYFWNLIIYSTSKLYNIMGSNEFARRLEGSGVTSNSLHPGAVHTDLLRDFSPFERNVFNTLFRLFFKSAEEGAQTTIYLSIHDDVKNVTGKYFSDCQEGYSLPVTRNREIGKKFWDKCCDLVNLAPEERFI